MKPFLSIFAIFLLSLAAFAQKPTDILATATGHTVKLSDLSPEVQKAVTTCPPVSPNSELICSIR